MARTGGTGNSMSLSAIRSKISALGSLGAQVGSASKLPSASIRLLREVGTAFGVSWAVILSSCRNHTVSACTVSRTEAPM